MQTIDLPPIVPKKPSEDMAPIVAYYGLFAKKYTDHRDPLHVHRVVCREAQELVRMYPLIYACWVCRTSMFDPDTWEWSNRCFECGWVRNEAARVGAVPSPTLFSEGA